MQTIAALALLLCIAFYAQYGKTKYILYGDSLGYYMYLPSAFIYHNLDSLEKLPEDRGIPHTVLDYAHSKPENDTRSPLGHFINQYTCGVALFELPFFAAAHGLAHLCDKNPNGYSEIYQASIRWSSLFYSILGILFLWGWLRRHIDSADSTLSIALLLLGSNLFWFALVQLGMSHPISFLLYVLLLRTSPAIYLRSHFRDFAVVAALLGLLILVRATDGIAVLLPMFYGVYTRTDVKQRIGFWWRHLSKILPSILLLLLVLSPQLWYWKKYAGSFLYYSYGTQKFFWSNPQILKGLFGFENGWIPYSTVMLPAVVALFYFYRHLRLFVVASILILVLHIYVSYSWWCYNYINGYGSRPMINIYPLLALPLGLMLQRWRLIKPRLRWIPYVLIFLLLSHNLSMMYQQARLELVSDFSNKAYYFSTLFKSPIEYRDLATYDSELMQPSEEDYVLGENGGIVDFEDSIYTDKFGEFCTVSRSKPGGDFDHYVTMEQSADVPCDYVRIETKVCIPEIKVDYFNQPLLVFTLERAGEKIWHAISLHNKVCMESYCDLNRSPDFWHLHSNQFGRMFFLVPLSSLGGLQKGDQIQYGIWNPAETDYLVDYIRMDFCDQQNKTN